MSYKKEKVQVYDVKTGYNKIAKEYADFHSKLDQWDNGLFKKFLPRDLKGVSVIDLGAGDGRTSKFFVNKGLNRYLACDIAESLLKRNKNWVEKMILDLEKTPYDLADDSFDLALSFFVLLHINNINGLFEEVYRILKPGGRFIVLHHIERRPYEYRYDGVTFKIENISHRYEDVEEIAKKNFFDIDEESILENNTLVGKIYCFTKA